MTEVKEKPNRNKIQTYHNITLRRITNGPFYISNSGLHNDFHISKQLKKNPRIILRAILRTLWKP